MVIMQWWLDCMLQAIEFQLYNISLTNANGTQNATTSQSRSTLG
jgi:hypothetical protein